MKTNVWSKYPRLSYTVEGVGVGSLPVFDAVPGAWNLLALSCNALDTLSVYNAGADTAQLPTTAIALSVALALYYDPTTEKYVGEAAETMTPEQFMEYLRQMRPSPDPIEIFGSAWWDYMDSRVAAWCPPVADNVIKGQFGQRNIVR